MPRKRQQLMLKFRLRLTHPMPKSEAYKKLRRALRTGMVPEGIEIMAMDWESGGGKSWSEGAIPPEDLHSMQGFFRVFMAADGEGGYRAEKV